MQFISDTELKIGDVFIKQNTSLTEKYLVITHDKINEIEKLIVYSFINSKLEYYFYQSANVFLVANIYDTYSNEKIENANITKAYKWLGIEYEQIKVLIDLETMNIETYDYLKDNWISFENYSESKNLLILDFDDKVKFKICFKPFKVSILTQNLLRYKNYNNFLLGYENDYVFNPNNDLELIREEEVIKDYE